MGREKYKHTTFCGFYPSDVFSFGHGSEKSKEYESTSRSIAELQDLKQLYKTSMPSSMNKAQIIEKCKYYKRILQLGIEETDFFSDASQRITVEYVPIISLWVSVMVMCGSYIDYQKNPLVPLSFGIIAIIGTCILYCKSIRIKQVHKKIKEMYRNMLMCFETLEAAVK